LHYAASEGNFIEVSRLLAQGADPNAQDDNGWTSMHFAAQASSLACIRRLLDAGANPELVDAHGNIVLLGAVFASGGNGEIIRLLRATGADSYAANAAGLHLSLLHELSRTSMWPSFSPTFRSQFLCPTSIRANAL
jgi:ankyrin repeat protein